MNHDKIACTVAILTFNSGATIKSALESVKNFSEIIVCDGGSTDETLALVRAYGAKVLVQSPEFKNGNNQIVNFAGVRNQTLDASSNRWFFYLDSDETMTEPLAREIDSRISSGHPAAAFWVPRKYSLRGKVVDCASTYPTKQMRFFHKNAVTGFIKTIHERIEVKRGVPVLGLHNYMLVPMNPDPNFHRKKWERYIELEATRTGTISFWGWLLVCTDNLKVSLLYAFRYFRNLFFCRGKRMPWRLEWERHMYHINTCRRFWKLMLKSF